MAKAPSAEIGQKRYYHSLYGAGLGCTCVTLGGKVDRDPACPYTFPSVTTVLDSWPKPWLGPWAAKMVAEIAVDGASTVLAMLGTEGREATLRYLKGAPWRKRDEAAERGTAAHKAAEEGTAIEDVPEAARKRVEAWHRWLDDWHPEIIAQEVTVYQPFPLFGSIHEAIVRPDLRYAGTLDLIARVGADTWLIDLKAADAKHSHRLQLAAYRHADYIGGEAGRERDMIPVDRMAVLSLKDDGYSWIEVSAGADEYQAFLTCAAQARNYARVEKGPVGKEVKR